MTTTTPTTALADLDLDKLEALARSFCADCVTIEMSMNPSDVLNLIALARRAAQPVAPVRADARSLLERAHRVISCAAIAKIRDGEATWEDIGKYLATPAPASAGQAGQVAMTYTVDGIVMSPLEYIDHLHGQLAECMAATAKWAAAAGAASVDADRYRWLRDKGSNSLDQFGSFSPYVIQGQTMNPLEGSQIDAAVDVEINRAAANSTGGQ